MTTNHNLLNRVLFSMVSFPIVPCPTDIARIAVNYALFKLQKLDPCYQQVKLDWPRHCVEKQSVDSTVYPVVILYPLGLERVKGPDMEH